MPRTIVAADEPSQFTARQRRILDFVNEFAAAHGRVPTTREIGEAAGLVAPSSVAYHLDVLARRGVLPHCP